MQKDIVILGGGFAGLTLARELDKVFRKDHGVHITLIDRKPYQTFYPSLYEVASGMEEVAGMRDLKASVAVPLQESLKYSRIDFLLGDVQQVDMKNRQVVLPFRTLSYDHLVLAMGSVCNYYGIPGAEERALPLKSAAHALRIRSEIASVVQMHQYDATKRAIKIVVAGGGFAGCELAAELPGYLDFLAWKFGYPREKLELYIVEGANRLLPGLHDQASKDTYARLFSLGVRIELNAVMTKVEPGFLNFASTERLAYDCLIWTAGIAGCPMPSGATCSVDRGCRVILNEYLQSKDFPEVYIIGDQGAAPGKDGRPVPSTAQYAMKQAQYLATAFKERFAGQHPKPFVAQSLPYIIPLGKKYALFVGKRFYHAGFLAYLLMYAAHFRYFARILGVWKAFKLIVLQYELYSKND